MKVFLKQDAPIPKVVLWWHKVRYEDASGWGTLGKPMVNDWEAHVDCL